MKKVFMLLMGMMVFAACATTKKESHSGFLSDYYKYLKPGVEEGAPKLMWIKPGVDHTKYKKVMVDYVIFAFADDAEYKGIDANEMKKIADSASLALVNSLKKEFPVVSQPGPDVLRIRTAIVDLRPSRPALSAVTSVTPMGLGISILKKGATDHWTGSGATTAEMMVLDSMTHEVIAAGEDQKEAGFKERFTKWGSVDEAFEFWGERLTKRLVHFTKKK